MLEADHRNPHQRAVLLICVVALLRTGVSDSMNVTAPSGCRHTRANSWLVADCQAQEHRTVPEISPSTQILLLTFNRLSAVLNSSFPRLESLQRLSLGGQQGDPLFVGERAFQNVVNITFLDLGGNPDLVLHPAALAGLANLEVLLLDSSGFDEDILELGYLRDLVSLRRLDLSGNRLRRLRPDPTFRGLERLSVLQLKLNRIGAVCGDDLRHLQGRHLSLLDLSSNYLSHRQACANPFHNITLGTLDVSSNPWGVMEAERFLMSLQGTRIQEPQDAALGGHWEWVWFPQPQGPLGEHLLGAAAQRCPQPRHFPRFPQRVGLLNLLGPPGSPGPAPEVQPNLQDPRGGLCQAGPAARP